MDRSSSRYLRHSVTTAILAIGAIRLIGAIVTRPLVNTREHFTSSALGRGQWTSSASEGSASEERAAKGGAAKGAAKGVAVTTIARSYDSGFLACFPPMHLEDILRTLHSGGRSLT